MYIHTYIYIHIQSLIHTHIHKRQDSIVNMGGGGGVRGRAWGDLIGGSDPVHWANQP